MPSPNSGATPRGGPGTGGGEGGEFAAIEALRRRLPGPPAGEVWIGDDAAVLGPAEGRLLLTTDMAVAGVHADLEVLSLADLGWRAVAAAVSDIAAMGGRAGHAVVAVAGPPTTDLGLLYDGIAGCARAHGCPIVGGDLSTAEEVVVAVAVIGHVATTPGPVRRAGAGADDTLFVTGPLGAAAAGLRVLRARASGVRAGGARAARTAGTGTAGAPRPGDEEALVAAHRRPRARLAEGEVARLAGATAMVDVSDGLLADLGHVADASAVGFRLDEVPVAAGATSEEALGGGEDYQLVVATPDPGGLLAAFAAAGLGLPVRIGRCTADRDERILGGAPVPALGWEHAWRPPSAPEVV